MTSHEVKIDEAVEQFHEDVPHQFQVSLSMSLHTRNALDAIKDELNEAAGERICTTNDAMQLALVAAGRYHELATSEEATLDDVDREQLIPLTEAIQTVLEENEIRLE